MIVAAAFVAGVLVAAGLWVLMAPAFAGEIFARENYRGRTLPTAVGVLVALAVLAVDAVVTLAVAAGAVRMPVAEPGRWRRYGQRCRVGATACERHRHRDNRHRVV